MVLFFYYLPLDNQKYSSSTQASVNPIGLINISNVTLSCPCCISTSQDPGEFQRRGKGEKEKEEDEGGKRGEEKKKEEKKKKKKKEEKKKEEKKKKKEMNKEKEEEKEPWMKTLSALN